jgi:hypothetical protein
MNVALLPFSALVYQTVQGSKIVTVGEDFPRYGMLASEIRKIPFAFTYAAFTPRALNPV